MGIIAQIKYVLIAVFFGVLLFLYSKWQSASQEASWYKSLHETNIATGNLRQMKRSIDSLNIPIKTRNISEVSHITTTTETFINIIRKDSIINGIPIDCISGTNGYTTVNGCGDTLKFTHKDTLDIVLHKKPTKKFLFIHYAKKDTMQIFNKDKDSHYTIRSFRRER